MLQPAGPLVPAAAILIHLAVPAAGLAGYLALLRRMRAEAVAHPPARAMFLLFATYGGWVMVILTWLLWAWSGAASLGLAYLVLLAPFVLGGVALRLRARRTLSRYHRAAFWAAAAYVPVTVVLLGGILLFAPA